MPVMSGKWCLAFVLLLSLSFTQAQSEEDNKEDCKYVVYNVHQMNQVMIINPTIIIYFGCACYCFCGHAGLCNMTREAWPVMDDS